MIAAELPPLFARWAGEFLDGPIPAERNATCSDCAMCAREADAGPGARASDAEVYYSPATKCCTYLPELANFLVGGILSDDSSEAAAGRATIEARIHSRVGVTPLGLGRSPVYALLYTHSPDAFGKAEALACPHHLADGRCGVWRHRESTCATWFCKHERGQVGKHFWRRLHDLLAAAELVLSRHCVLQLGLPQSALEALFPARGAGAPSTLDGSELDRKVDPRAYAACWGQYLGREAELYRAAAALVAGLTFRDVLAIGGAELALRVELARAAYAALIAREVPARVRPRALQVLYGAGESARVATYSQLDPLRVPKKLLHVLHQFEGRTTDDALAAIRREHKLRVSPGLVRKLVDFRILDEDSPPPEPSP